MKHLKSLFGVLAVVLVFLMTQFGFGVKAEAKGTTHCWNCKTTIVRSECSNCSVCGWDICPNCGACSYDCIGKAQRASSSTTKKTTTSTSTTTTKKDYTTYCWNCGKQIDRLTTPNCDTCGWDICPKCGACKEDNLCSAEVSRMESKTTTTNTPSTKTTTKTTTSSVKTTSAKSSTATTNVKSTSTASAKVSTTSADDNVEAIVIFVLLIIGVFVPVFSVIGSTDKK